MRETDIGQFVQENEWIDSAFIVGVDVDSQVCRVCVELSPAGHRLTRDHGMQEFEERILCHQQADDKSRNVWEIAPQQSGSDGQDIPQQGPDFPAILSTLDESPEHRWLMLISPELDWFRGHFPDNPVLPGVVQLHWAVTAAHACAPPNRCCYTWIRTRPPLLPWRPTSTRPSRRS